MAVTATSLKALGGSAFAAIADATVDAWIAIADQRVDATVFGDLYDNALSFLTLHLLQSFVLTGGGTSGPTGEVSSLTVGAVSVSFNTANSAAMDAEYGSTAWGKQFLSLVRLAYQGPFAG